ncbi:(Fe-S)-binding protein [Caldilinea sp.]|jgi:L-lactate dehydrogenase complex protein LldE|uniref:(Fe-S)-binding protein n=1 Tax=Caldilinea sp. TaxID=2293560 RepID=UPI00262AA2EA|nr:(Fe-S)-binding protein [Caldilinea sp.]
MMQKKQFDAPPRRVALFVTCMVDMIYPEVGMATVELLERCGVEVVFPFEQTCCGQPAFNSGFWEEARPLARRFIDIFEPLVRSGEVDAVVAPSGSCTTMTSHFYSLLLQDEPEYRARAEFLGAATFELTEFLVDVLGVEEFGARCEGKLTYHACCHLLRELGIDRQPRALLRRVEGAERVELPGAEECCGFGGLFAIKNSEISVAMGQRKVQNIVKSGADVVALCDVSCMTHINGLLSRQGHRCRAVHIAQVLASQIEVTPSPPQEQESRPSSAPPRRWQDVGR